MKTEKQIFDKHYEVYRNLHNQPAIPLEARQMIFNAMKEYAIQYRMCAMADEKICDTQCFTCSEDEACDFKNLHKAPVMQRSEQLVCEKCGKDASDGYRTVTGNVCLGCSGF